MKKSTILKIMDILEEYEELVNYFCDFELSHKQKASLEVIKEELLSQEVMKKQKEFFEITSLSRDDIESLGFKAKDLTDDEMQYIAHKMGNIWCDTGYWDTLESIMLDIQERE